MATISLIAISGRIERLANWILEEDRNREATAASFLPAANGLCLRALA
jgi:hypothetical protein